jgi:hypothetical protein
MSLKQFMGEILDELQEIKGNENKKRYSVLELEFEVSFIAKKEGSIGTGKMWDFVIPTIEGKYSKDNIQKVKIKLKPRGNTSNLKKQDTNR